MILNVSTYIPVQDQSDKNLVRGKLADDSKPRTFNQLWTPEEQVHTMCHCLMCEKTSVVF